MTPSKVRTGTYQAPFVLDAHQKYDGAQEKADAQVQVHHGSRALDGLHQEEGHDTQQQADQGKRQPHLGDQLQSRVLGEELRMSGVPLHLSWGQGALFPYTQNAYLT